MREPEYWTSEYEAQEHKAKEGYKSGGGVGLVRAGVGLFSKEHCSFFRGVGVAVGGGSSISIISLSFFV